MGAVDWLAAIFSALDGRRLDWAVINDPTLLVGSAVRDGALSYRARLHRLAVEGTREVLGGRHGYRNWWLGHPDETAAAMTDRCNRFIAALSAAGKNPAAPGRP